MYPELFYQIALRQTPNVGDITAKALFAHFGTATAVFEADALDLAVCTGATRPVVEGILSKASFKLAERELRFIEREQITPLLYTDAAYPQRLRPYEEQPFLLFYRGNLQALHSARTLAVIGTRRPTAAGTSHCERFVQALLEAAQPVVISGLAYGIDITAHRRCVQLRQPTVAIVGNGLDKIYPSLHKATVEEMIATGGGILSEFVSGTRPAREHFPMRNRIIAALSDAVLVVETAAQGGSIITAQLANDYRKDVFALPGRIEDPFSAGCNWLIKKQLATLIDQPSDLLDTLHWQRPSPLSAAVSPTSAQHHLFEQLSDDEQRIVRLLTGTPSQHLDMLTQQTQISTSRLAALLLDLELRAIVRALPGKHYQLC